MENPTEMTAERLSPEVLKTLEGIQRSAKRASQNGWSRMAVMVASIVITGISTWYVSSIRMEERFAAFSSQTRECVADLKSQLKAMDEVGARGTNVRLATIETKLDLISRRLDELNRRMELRGD